ncbi:hypothetical protein KGP36_07280 [Patescibacteria group bacterium]|nr:hypothetical protein [Patescibacteria group bacterium]
MRHERKTDIAGVVIDAPKQEVTKVAGLGHENTVAVGEAIGRNGRGTEKKQSASLEREKV